MNTRLAPLLATLSLLLAVPHSSEAKDIRVALLVDTSDSIKTQILGSITRQLTEFGDVVISFEDFDYQLSVVSLILSPCGVEPGSESDGQGLVDSGGTGPLYAFSLVVAKSPAGIRANPAQYGALLGHNLRSDTDLEALCKWVVTETNAHVFEPERKARNSSPEASPRKSPPR